MRMAFGNSSAAVFQIHFAPSPISTCRFAAANPNRRAARKSRSANGDGIGSTSFDRALSIAAVCRAEPASRSGKPVFGSLRSAVWNTATFASHASLRFQRVPRQHPVRHRDSVRFGCGKPSAYAGIAMTLQPQPPPAH